MCTRSGHLYTSVVTDVVAFTDVTLMLSVTRRLVEPFVVIALQPSVTSRIRWFSSTAYRAKYARVSSSA